MTRRQFVAAVTLSLVAAPLAVEAQPAGKVPRVGYLSASSPSIEGHRRKAFGEGLRNLGWIEGQSIFVEERCRSKPRRKSG